MSNTTEAVSKLHTMWSQNQHSSTTLDQLYSLHAFLSATLYHRRCHNLSANPPIVIPNSSHSHHSVTCLSVSPVKGQGCGLCRVNERWRAWWWLVVVGRGERMTLSSDTDSLAHQSPVVTVTGTLTGQWWCPSDVPRSVSVVPGGFYLETFKVC